MDLGTAVASVWSAGISMYGVAALLGIAGRLDWTDTPAWLQEPWVIAIALALFVVEFIVDKIAWLDSGWDAVHTFLRPFAGVVLLGGSEGTDREVLAAVSGGTLAFSAHAAKASVRALVNTSPEPVSNVVVSLVEDGFVAALMALAIAYPVAAGIVTLVLFVASAVVTFVLYRAARAAIARLGARRRGKPPDPDAPFSPPP